MKFFVKNETDGCDPHGRTSDSTPAFSSSDLADDEDTEPPSIVIYMLDPFSFASDSLDLGRLTTLGLLRCFHQMLQSLSETTQLNVSLQLVSLDAVLQVSHLIFHIFPGPGFESRRCLNLFLGHLIFHIFSGPGFESRRYLNLFFFFFF